MEDFGFPPIFPPDTNVDVEEEKAAAPKDSENKVDNKSKSKKVILAKNVNQFVFCFCSNRVKQQQRVVVKNINGK